jgi:hypothetical protein
MMDTLKPPKIPADLRMIAQNRDIKKVWYNYPAPSRLVNDCPNCSGWGFMTCFAAIKGPFKGPSSTPGEVSHWADDAWWVGSSYEAPCPVCQGTGIRQWEREAAACG